MNLSILFARFFGLYLLLICIPLIGQPYYFRERYRACFENDDIQWVSGFLHLILGLIYVLLHNIWVNDWRISITLISWLVLIEGISIIYFPNHTKNVLRKYVMHVPPYLWAAFCFGLGVFFIYQGFFARVPG